MKCLLYIECDTTEELLATSMMLMKGNVTFLHGTGGCNSKISFRVRSINPEMKIKTTK